MKNKKINELLKNHQAASLRAYSFDDPYKEALKDMKTLNQRRAEKFLKRNKKLGRTKRLMPSPKV